MNSFYAFAEHHPFMLLGSFWVFVAVVSTMPSPKSGSWTDGLGYAWAFNALHALSGTVGRILAQYPATRGFTGQQVLPPKEPPTGTP